MPSSIDLADKPVAVQGIGAAGYPAIDLRRLAIADIGQEGVVGVGDFKVTSGGALTLSVATGEAAIDGDSVSNQGRYYQRNAAAIAGTLTLVNPPDAANPRIDQIVLEVKDDAHDASGLNTGRIRVVQGTATAGATLDNRTGAAALPSTAMRLADLLVPAAFAGPFVAVTHIRDRRPWARGFHRRIERVANAAAGNDYTTTSAVRAAIDATNLQTRVELSGAPVRLHLYGDFIHSVANTATTLDVDVDGVAVNSNQWLVRLSHTADVFCALVYEYVPPPGGHVVKPFWRTSVATATLEARAANPMQFIVEEVIRQDADNST